MTMDGAELYATFGDRVLAYVSARVSNRQDAEDITAETFEKAMRALPRYDEAKASYSTWVYTIARNTMTDYFRKRRQFAVLSDEVASDEQVDDGLLSEETLEELARALARLSQDERDVVVLRYYHGLPLTEVADKMRMSYGMVKLRHQSALAALRNALA